MKSIINRSEYILGAILVVIGICAIILAFFNSPVQLQIAVGLAGLAFICLGLLQFKKVHERMEINENFEKLYTKLDEIKQEIEKEEKPAGTGVAIADIISSGLKYYSEHMNKDRDEE
jgi:low affinity Fe/Cu permease